jgi:hypothetical protein
MCTPYPALVYYGYGPRPSGRVQMSGDGVQCQVQGQGLGSLVLSLYKHRSIGYDEILRLMKARISWYGLVLRKKHETDTYRTPE